MQRVSLGSAAAASAAGAAQQQQAPKHTAVAPASTPASTQVGPNGMAPKRLGPVAADGSTMSKVSTAGRMLGVTAARAGESTATQGTHVRPHAHPHTQSPTPPWPLQAKADREKQKQNPAYREKERVSVGCELGVQREAPAPAPVQSSGCLHAWPGVAVNLAVKHRRAHARSLPPLRRRASRPTWTGRWQSGGEGGRAHCFELKLQLEGGAAGAGAADSSSWGREWGERMQSRQVPVIVSWLLAPNSSPAHS